MKGYCVVLALLLSLGVVLGQVPYLNFLVALDVQSEAEACAAYLTASSAPGYIVSLSKGSWGVSAVVDCTKGAFVFKPNHPCGDSRPIGGSTFSFTPNGTYAAGQIVSMELNFKHPTQQDCVNLAGLGLFTASIDYFYTDGTQYCQPPGSTSYYRGDSSTPWTPNIEFNNIKREGDYSFVGTVSCSLNQFGTRDEAKVEHGERRRLRRS